VSRTLGIFVTADAGFDHLLGLVRAAGQRGDTAVEVFLSHNGVRLIREERFGELTAGATVSICDRSFSEHGLTRPVPGLTDEAFVTQARHDHLIAHCDRYLVL